MANIDLLSYKGDAGLGLGSNPGIAALDRRDVDLGVLQQTARDLMLTERQENLVKWQQKKKEQDDLRRMIENDQVATGEILPEYQPVYNEAEKRVQTAYTKWGGNPDDVNGYREYKNAVQDLKDVATHAQVNTVAAKNLDIAAANETLPRKRADILAFTARQKSQPFWNQIEPYQKQFDLNTDPILKSVQTTTTSIPATEQSPYDTTVTAVDFTGTKNAIDNQYREDVDAAEDMRVLLNSFDRMPPNQRVQTLQAMNNQLQKYNLQREAQGLEPDAQPVKFDPQTGMIQELPNDFATKYAIANKEQFVSRDTKFNDKMGAYMNAKRKNDIAAMNAQTGRLNYQLRKTNADKQDAQQQQFSQQYDGFLGNMEVTDQNAPNEKNKFLPPGLSYQKETTDIFKIPVSSIPQGWLYNQGLNAKGEPIQTVPYGAEEKTTIVNGKPQTTLDVSKGYVVPQFFIPRGTILNGKQVGKDQELTPQDVLKYAKAAGFSNAKDFILDMQKKGMIDFNIKGKNGTATRGSSFVSQMSLGNKVTNSKADVNPYQEETLTVDQTEETP